MKKNLLEQKVFHAVDSALRSSLKEAYVAVPKKFSLKTEKLSEKVKRSMLDKFEKTVSSLNKISAQLDGADLNEANNSINSNFRSLKMSEAYAVNDSFLSAEFLENISDINSSISMDNLAYIRLSRDFGDFDTWQKSFIACAKSSRGGYAITAYCIYLKRYMNFVIDDASCGVPIGSVPVIVLNVGKDCYSRDYLNNIDAYIKNMMVELNWTEIEKRFQNCEKLSRVFGG